MIAGVGAVAYAVLTVLVVTHATQHLDVVLRDHFRPDNVWGPAQLRAVHIVDDAQPRVMALLLTVVGVATSLHRRSVRPAVYLALIGASAAAVTVATKAVYVRPDPHFQTAAHNGSFPSGHTVTILICLGGALLVLQRRTRWWQWLVVAAGGLAMGYGLLVIGGHWFTDLLGAAIVAPSVLVAASTWKLREPVQPAEPTERRASSAARA